MARLTLGTAALALAAFAALAAMSFAAHAQASLPDPTRPPAALAATPAAPAASGAEGALQLQSVLVGRGRTPAAVISGQLVTLGGRVRDARLVRLGERSAVLSGPQGEITLRLVGLEPARSPGEPHNTNPAESSR